MALELAIEDRKHTMNRIFVLSCAEEGVWFSRPRDLVRQKDQNTISRKVLFPSKIFFVPSRIEIPALDKRFHEIAESRIPVFMDPIVVLVRAT